MRRQEGNALLFHTVDGGELTIEDGLVEMGGGLESAVYLCLFGGNEDDDGREANKLGWWGNAAETNPARRYVSKTLNLLAGLPATSANLSRIEDAAKSDLEVLITEGVASSVTVSARITGLNKVSIGVEIVSDETEYYFSFLQNWISRS